MPIRRMTPVMCLVLSASAACRHSSPSDAPLTPVVVQAAAPYLDPSGLRYSASIEPNMRVDLAFKAGGYVESLMQVRGPDGRMRDLQDGDRVERGAVLAKLKDTDYVDKREQALSQLRQAQVSLDYASQELGRADRLFAAKSLTKADHDAATMRRDVARAQLDGARALVQQADAAIADTTLRSPIGGVVMKRLVEVGSLAGPGTPGFVLADTHQVKVVFGAPDVVMRSLKVGSPQTVVTAAFPDRPLHGTISRIAPTVDPSSHVFDVEVTLPNSEDHLKVGMVAGLEIAQGSGVSAPVVVPLSAIVRAPRSANDYAVLVVEERDGRQIARARTVRLGQTLGNAIAITEGLRAGERVIVRGATLVNDGDQVAVAKL